MSYTYEMKYLWNSNSPDQSLMAGKPHLGKISNWEVRYTSCTTRVVFGQFQDRQDCRRGITDEIVSMDLMDDGTTEVETTRAQFTLVGKERKVGVQSLLA